MKVSPWAKRAGILGKERIWGHHEETVFAEAKESLCPEASHCKFAEEGNTWE